MEIYKVVYSEPAYDDDEVGFLMEKRDLRGHDNKQLSFNPKMRPEPQGNADLDLIG
jgi:hypothetical protein